MHAYVRTGPTDLTVLRQQISAPALDPTEIRVAVRAFGVGVHDRYFIPDTAVFPFTIGIEGAGEVVELGSDVDAVWSGRRVMVTAALSPKGGTWAEEIVVAPSNLRPIPDDLEMATAAGIPIAGKTALDSLHALHLEAGETLFVAGASGAIGTLVVQLATSRGIRVIGSASADNHAYLESLGADAAVDYRDPMWPKEVRHLTDGGADAALAIQPGTPPACVGIVRDGGRVVTVSGDPCPGERGIRVEQFVHRMDATADMNALIDDITSSRIHLVLERVLPFDDALEALEKTETRHARGKSVVTVP